MTPIRRIVAAGLLAALLVAIGGLALERLRFGTSDADAMARVKSELQQRFDASAETLGRIAADVARHGDAVRAARRDTGNARALFDAVEQARPTDDGGRTGISVYDAAAAPLAWTGRVSDLPRQRIEGPAALFVAPGALGPRLIRIDPLLNRSRPVGRDGTIVVEQELADVEDARGLGDAFAVDTALAPATLRAHIRGAEAPANLYRFTIASLAGDALVDAEVLPSELAAAREGWRRRTWAAAIGVLAVTLLLSVAPIIDLRRRTRATGVYLATTAGLAGAVLAARFVFSLVIALASKLRPPTDPLELFADGLTIATLVWLALDLVERRRVVRPSVRLLAPSLPSAILVGGTFLLAGIVDTSVLVGYERLLQRIILSTTFDLLHFSHYPLTFDRLVLASGVVLLHAGVIWAAAALLRAPSMLWRTPRRFGAALAAIGWLVGVALMTTWMVRAQMTSAAVRPLLVALAAVALCAAALARVGGKAHRQSQAMRLSALSLALLVPAVAMYPSVAALATNAKEEVVAATYRPQAESLRKDLQDRMRRSLDEIDALPNLRGFLVPPEDEPATSDRAFRLWSQTDLATYRLTSAVELYASDGRLVSRFALNLPESTGARYSATGCQWDVFDEESPFGANQRHVLRANRGICEHSRFAGAIVVRAMLDYRTLPFGLSQGPYVDSLLREAHPSQNESSEQDVEFAAYGWSRAPIFVSGTSVWILPDDVFQQMVASRRPLWTEIDRDREPFRVYFFNDRGGIYALGYRATTLFGHLINVVELATLAIALYILLLGAGTVVNALTSRTPASGRTLLREVRSSFYRKLFIYFVAGAVVPVVILAIATRTYFASQLRAGIDEAAAKTATVAQRLVEDYATLQQRGPGVLGFIDDQIMVLVGQAIDQDVNLFDRGRLQATSQRDLFESRVLSTRTPADAYRAILLDRLPTFVGDERAGALSYRLAAAPVRAGEREGVVTVPLTLRQQEIERQIDELDHRVLFGAVLFSLVGAGLGYWLAERIADPVNRLTRATRRIARGDLDARIAATSSDELRRLVEDFNQMAADLKRQRSELERTQRLEAWAEMARQVAHDIKNPLTPIQLSAEHARRVNLDRGRPLSPALDNCVDAILTQVRLLRQIATEFSNFASSPKPRIEPTDVTRLIEEVVDPYRTGLGGRIAIDLIAPAGLPPVGLDRTLFSRALTNIIENALHAMPGTGRLTITTGQSPTAGPKSVIVEITDTGVGMDEQALEKIFEPYFSTKATGTGLGLTIAKRNIEAHGGTIEVRSGRGVGTRVTITLPA